MVVCDVAVIGAGPAGLAAAMRLRQLGRSVVVLDRVRPPTARVEALTPGVAAILRYLGAEAVLLSSEANLIQRHRVAWTTLEVVTREPSPGEASLLVQRRRFDKELASLALAQGVILCPCSRLIGIEALDDQRIVRYTQDGEEKVVAVRCILEATGRGSSAAKRRQLGPALIALSATFRVPAASSPEMLVEALPDGWLWGAHGPGEVLNVIAFADPAHVHSNWPGEPERALRAFLATSTLFCGLGESGSFDGACDAGSYWCEDWLQDGRWKIGDAALSLDPLSSSGVEKSMRFALQAALAVNTVLMPNGDRAAALAFLSMKLSDIRDRHVAWTQEHYASCWGWPNTPFWQARGTAQSLGDAGTQSSGQVEQLSMSQVLVGIPRIADGVSFEVSPCALEDRIEVKPAVCHPNFAEPVVFVDGIELIPLLRAASGAGSYPELIDRWTRWMPREQAIRVCAWALRNGMLTGERALGQ